jgi:polar amino acid transport system permease protein
MMAKVGTAGFLFILLSLGCWVVLASSIQNSEVIWKYRQAFWTGWLVTVKLSAVALLLSTVIGLAAAMAKRSKFLPVRYTAIVYIETIRGIPLLVLLLFLYYGVFNAVGFDHRLSAGVLILSLFSGAYIAEILRAGIESVGHSQWESARAIGLTNTQTYTYIVCPQALKHSTPALAGQFASLIKDSSLLSILGIAEFTFTAQQVNSATLSTLECYLPLSIGYLILTVPLSLWSKKLENALRYET